MINTKMIARIMGSLFFIEAGFLILCSFLAVYYNESDLSAFLTSTAITVGAGIIASLTGKNAEKKISRRDGYVIVTFAWVFFCFIRYASILSERIYSLYNGRFL